nr:PREDICTED: serine/threonine-protein kinase SMG1-like [Bemisia tabaci]
MISTNIAKELKASFRSPDVVRLSENEDKLKNTEKGGGDKVKSFFVTDSANRNQSRSTSRDKSENRTKNRRNKDEYRQVHNHTSSYKSGFKGKNSASRKTEDFSTRKFQESTPKNKIYNGSYSKYPNDAESRSRPDQSFVVSLPEDSRISTLLRKMAREDDDGALCNYCLQIQEAFTLPDNSRYIRRAQDLICESILGMLHNMRGKESKILLIKSLGCLGHALDQDFKSFMDWIFAKYKSESSNDIKISLMKVLSEVLNYDVAKPRLKDFASLLMLNLQKELEVIDQADLLIPTTEVVLTLLDYYTESSQKYLRDLLDILVGWHIDITQPGRVIWFVSDALQRLARLWIADMGFTLSVMSQFLDDMQCYTEDLASIANCKENEKDSRETLQSAQEAVSKLTLFLKVFNTMVKALGQHLNPSVYQHVSWTFLSDSLSKILSNVLEALQHTEDQELIITVNESVWLLLSVMQSKTCAAHEMLHQLIDYELDHSKSFRALTLASMLQLIAKIIKEVGANLSLDLVDKLLGPKSVILKFRFSESTRVHNGITTVFQSLLNLKNIPLLQGVYSYVIQDLKLAYEILTASNETSSESKEPKLYSKKDAEIVILFHLKGLCHLANEGTSLIGLWMLQPSILELMAIKLFAASEHVPPSVQYAHIYLLYSHCSKYSHFVTSSGLLIAQGRLNVSEMLGLSSAACDGISTISPTTGHLSIILTVLGKYVVSDLQFECKLLVLNWCSELLSVARMYLNVLSSTSEMLTLVKALIKEGTNSNRSSLLCCISVSLELLFLPPNTQCWPLPILLKTLELCVLHINSSDKVVCEQYSNLLLKIPWNLALLHLKSMAQNHNSSYWRVLSIQRMQFMRGTNGELRGTSGELRGTNTELQGKNGELTSHHFKTFMAYLLHGQKQTTYDTDEMWLTDMFSTCYDPNADAKPDYYNLVMNNSSALLRWVVWSSAQVCISNRLKTPLGRPLDTLMAIEGAIKGLARETISSSKQSEGDLRRARLLIEFLEHLEKGVYNAAQGTASAMLSPHKLVRNFFDTNKNTCEEWLTRNRMALMGVSLHAGIAAATIRHGFCHLQDLLDAGNSQTTEFQNAALHVAWAFSRLKEPDAIQGLFVWCRDVAGVQLPFLESLTSQAASKYEASIESYKKLQILDSVEETSEGKSHAHVLPVKKFVADQLTECYVALHDWSELGKWMEVEKTYWNTDNDAALTMRHQILGSNDVKIMDLYASGELEAANDLLSWPDEKINLSSNSWICFQKMKAAKMTLMTIGVNLAVGKLESNVDDMIHKQLQVTQELVSEGLRSSLSEIAEEAAILFRAASALKEKSSSAFVSHLLQLGDKDVPSSLLSEILWWTQVLVKIEGAENSKITDTYVSNLRQEICRKARKEGNFMLAKRQLINQLDHVLETNISPSLKMDKKLESSNLEQVANEFLKLTAESESNWSLPKLKAMTELSKLAYCHGTKETALEVYSKTAASIAQSKASVDSSIKEGFSRTLLTLSKWICVNNDLSKKSSDVISELLQLSEDSIVKLENVSGSAIADLIKCNLSENKTIIPESEVMAGRLMRLSALHCPSLRKAWHQFAGWSYRWGRRVLDQQDNVLNAEDKALVNQMVPSDSDREKILNILTVTTLTNDEEIDVEDIHTTEMIEWQLQNIVPFSKEQLKILVEIWRKSHVRVYSYYELSANAYFKYLELCDAPHPEKEDDDKTGSGIITATLRLLRLIVKHALELQNVLEVGLNCTPTSPWKNIIPQLFSRLNHPEPYVRRCVSELLCRLAVDSPHLITFPAVVGACTNKHISSVKLFNTCLPRKEQYDDLEILEDEEEDDEDANASGEENQTESDLESCFLAMVDTLAKQAPEAIAQVQLLVKELRRITLLWDELWLGTLQQHHSEMSRRVAQLEAEIKRVDSNPQLTDQEKDYLVSEKYRIITRPLLFILEQLHTIISVAPETPHETWFQDKYSACINQTLEKLRNPEDPRKPQEAWLSLKQLQASLQQRATKRTAMMLKMSEISPCLYELQNTQIAMPGVGRVVTIAGIKDQVAILPTKTKPKKLVFRGSDGKPYTYLFKGLEDLHLDERIMQFLSISNTMLSGSNYRARHYSVIPLGPRSGLISWVDNVTPLFALYKRWQQREAASKQSNVVRPAELFYAKLTPLLEEKGITNMDNRKDWPLPVLKQVLTELMAETPNYLLFKELWCMSLDAGSWWKTTKTYSRSLAVMSIIGYILGLGDRHLDNVLVDLVTGEVVHIDYNVCFEKGKTLRVPEKVPFRLTPNLRTALGATGVDGIFRLSCEHVLRVMKKGRETLLTLLEAFVYDPLIDWTLGNETGFTGAVYGGGKTLNLEMQQKRQQLEREVTCSMLTVRVAEMRFECQASRDKLMQELKNLQACIEEWLEETRKLEKGEERLAEQHEQLALVKEAEACPQHSLFSLPARYSSHQAATSAMEKVRTLLNEKVIDCDRHLAQYSAALSCISGPQLSQWLTEVNARTKVNDDQIFDLVSEFLQTSGQAALLSQCLQLESDVCEVRCEQTKLTSSCLELLHRYSTIIRLHPTARLDHHRATCYRRWASAIIQHMSPQIIAEVNLEFKTLFNSPDTNTLISQQALAYSIGLQNTLHDAQARLTKTYERSKSFPAADVELVLTEADKGILKARDRCPLALECVIITTLCNLNKRFLMMEAAAASAGDCLLDLTSRDGDWFLDDLCWTASSAVKLISYFPPPKSESSTEADFQSTLKCLHWAHKIFRILQELLVNVESIILPECLRTVLVGENSVLAMVAQLSHITNSTPVPLSELLHQLGLHLRFVVMGMPSPHSNALQVVKDLREQFKALTKVKEAEDSLSQGQMLLMAFNGLFENLYIETSQLFTALGTLQVPSVWKIVDQIREAKTFAAPVWEVEFREVLNDMFLLKRLQTMQDFFSLCTIMGAGFIGGAGAPTSFYSDDILCKPVRRFIADFLERNLLGVFSHTLAVTICLLLQRSGLNVTSEVEQRDIGAQNKVPLEELCHKNVEQSLRQGSLNSSALAQASSLVSHCENAWRRLEIAQRLTQDIEVSNNTVHRLQLQFTAHYWLHEDLLTIHSLPGPPLSRAHLMLDLRKTSSALLALQVKLGEVREQQSNLITTVEQRLKWAVGANPALTDILSAFETNVLTESERIGSEQRLAAAVAGLCSTFLHHEALRTRTKEALANDAAFMELIEKCDHAIYLSINTHGSLTPLEEGLVKLIPPGEVIDWSWLKKAETLISGCTLEVLHSIEPLQLAVFEAHNKVKICVQNLRRLTVSQLRIMADIRSLLKTFLKMEENSFSSLQEYLGHYKLYHEQLANLIKELLPDTFSASMARDAIIKISAIVELTPLIYDELLNLSLDKSVELKQKRPPLLRQEPVCMSPKKGVPAGLSTPKGRRRGVMQERNSYAMSVWRRVRLKLEGRDPDPTRKLTVQESVDWVIGEATNINNLALLYEGWTPWV